jgi:threonine/homoserine/homoserine lactone efflux protein
MLTAMGVGLVVAGVVIALFGDKTVTEDGGFISKMIRWPTGRAKWLKVAIGLALIYAGVMILMR